jgi:hypothetical protein
MEDDIGHANEFYRLGTDYQQPRWAQLTFGLQF